MKLVAQLAVLHDEILAGITVPDVCDRLAIKIQGMRDSLDDPVIDAEQFTKTILAGVDEESHGSIMR